MNTCCCVAIVNVELSEIYSNMNADVRWTSSSILNQLHCLIDAARESCSNKQALFPNQGVIVIACGVCVGDGLFVVLSLALPSCSVMHSCLLGRQAELTDVGQKKVIAWSASHNTGT
jgi:hypothetical protein